jgi:large subunit ribosomal protein L9
MPKSLELLLVENVEALGIVGDVVKVRTGYARNFLLPRALATQPSDEKIKELQGKRAEAQRQLALQRKHREELIEKLKGIELTLIRSCNDLGHLYASITQQDIAAALGELGHGVKPRDVRISQVMKRIDNYDVHVKLDSDLDAIVKVHIKPDREIEIHKEEEAAPEGAAAGGKGQTEQQRLDAMEEAAKATRGTWGAPKTEKKEEAPADGKKSKGDKPAKSGEKGDKAEKAEKSDKGEKKGKPEAEAGEKKGKKKDKA